MLLNPSACEVFEDLLWQLPALSCQVVLHLGLVGHQNLLHALEDEIVVVRGPGFSFRKVSAALGSAHATPTTFVATVGSLATIDWMTPGWSAVEIKPTHFQTCNTKIILIILIPLAYLLIWGGTFKSINRR